MISTALVAIGHTFGIGAADTAWLISVLYLASAIAQPVLGKLADALGPRRIFLAGLVVVIASLQRTAQYIGAIAASSLIALAYANEASDAGLHLMAVVSAVLGLLLIILTVSDRALRARD